jgi:ATP-dependent Clp protease ATP-binding subunit ClpC
MNWFKKLFTKPKSRESDSREFLQNFMPSAEKVMALANEEALRLNHNFIGTEHILLGLVKLGNGMAANVLAKFELNLEKTRTEVEKIDGRGPGRKITFSLPYTPRVKEVLKMARNDAKLLKHTYIGTEHLLLGILSEGKGVAVMVLKKFNVNIEQTRIEMLNEINPNFLSSDDGQKKSS